MEKTVFVKLRHRVQVKPRAVVVIGDVAQITANDSNIAEQLKAVPLYRIQPSDKNIVIIDVMKVIRAMMEKDDALDVQVIGPAQTIIEVVDQKRRFSSAYFCLYGCCFLSDRQWPL